jgi:hypothetical protein
MRAKADSTLAAAPAPAVAGQLVSIFVPDAHPLLRLHRALEWAAIQEVMVNHWRAAGKNVDGGRGVRWPVELYVPLVVLQLVKSYQSRQMEEYVSGDVVARRFCGLNQQTALHVRDHSNIARAMGALGAEGIAAVNQLIIKQACALGFTGPELLSSDTTVQEPKLGYPHEPGILKGLAQRCARALVKLKQRGVKLAQAGIEQSKEIYRQVKQHHLFAKTKEQRRELLSVIVTKTEELMATTRQIIQQVGERRDRVQQSATAKLQRLGAVAAKLLPQVKQWMARGKVATEKILHAGLDEARAIVSNKAGRRVRFGMKWLIHRLRGGYVFGRRVAARASEYQMPLESLQDYRQQFGQQAKPKLQVYDRGGHCAETITKLHQEGVKKVGIPPCGQGAWAVREKDQAVVKSERGKTEGSIGRLKSQKYGFSHRQERSHPTQTAAGQRALVSANLNTLLCDLVKQAKATSVTQA